LADLNGDGHQEIIIGSWDRKVYAWRYDGQLLTSWPQSTGHFVWSTAAVGDIDKDGRPEVICASDQVYIWRADGTPQPGWPQATGSYSVATPLLADVDGDGDFEIIHCSERLYAWRNDGSPLPGFPVDLGSYLWSSPVSGDVDGDEQDEIVVGGWDGRLYVVAADGEIKFTSPTQGPIFATPTLSDLNRNGLAEIMIGSWDSKIHIFGNDSAYLVKRAPFDLKMKNISDFPIHKAGEFQHVREFLPIFIEFPGPAARQAIMYYRADFESDWHPVPLVVHQGKLTGLIQPFLAGTQVHYYAINEAPDGKEIRVPQEGTYNYGIRFDLGSRLQRKINKILR
jgi:hypothetical protein